MTKIFTQTEAFRSIVGVVAALLIGSTVLTAAVGPAVVTAGTSQSVNFAANSDIVRAA